MALLNKSMQGGDGGQGTTLDGFHQDGSEYGFIYNLSSRVGMARSFLIKLEAKNP